MVMTMVMTTTIRTTIKALISQEEMPTYNAAPWPERDDPRKCNLSIRVAQQGYSKLLQPRTLSRTSTRLQCLYSPTYFERGRREVPWSLSGRMMSRELAECLHVNRMMP